MPGSQPVSFFDELKRRNVLRDQPRYKALIASIEANMAEQRQALIAGTVVRQKVD